MIQCNNISFSGHALQKMFARNINEEMITEVINFGEVIRSYVDDKPYPSFLILGIVHQQPLHLVLAKNAESDKSIVVTAYFPDEKIWNSDFKTKK